MITLVLGGTRSGKSEVAERLATRAGEPVTYVATSAITDDDFAARIAAHQARRPASWSTVEEPADLPATLMRLTGTVLVDSLGTWIATTPEGDADVEGLSRSLTLRRGTTIVVSEEVGLGVHPPTAVGVRFADALGDCNRRIAQVADRVLLVIAGRTLTLGQES
jgi:adenosylcobinamide kinase / adenosylcobinamide-phosphate guanylyltransferase